MFTRKQIFKCTSINIFKLDATEWLRKCCQRYDISHGAVVVRNIFLLEAREQTTSPPGGEEADVSTPGVSECVMNKL